MVCPPHPPLRHTPHLSISCLSCPGSRPASPMPRNRTPRSCSASPSARSARVNSDMSSATSVSLRRQLSLEKAKTWRQGGKSVDREGRNRSTSPVQGREQAGRGGGSDPSAPLPPSPAHTVSACIPQSWHNVTVALNASRPAWWPCRQQRGHNTISEARGGGIVALSGVPVLLLKHAACGSCSWTLGSDHKLWCGQAAHLQRRQAAYLKCGQKTNLKCGQAVLCCPPCIAVHDDLIKQQGNTGRAYQCYDRYLGAMHSPLGLRKRSCLTRMSCVTRTVWGLHTAMCLGNAARFRLGGSAMLGGASRESAARAAGAMVRAWGPARLPVW